MQGGCVVQYNDVPGSDEEMELGLGSDASFASSGGESFSVRSLCAQQAFRHLNTIWRLQCRPSNHLLDICVNLNGHERQLTGQCRA